MPAVVECPGCGAEVWKAILRGVDIYVETQPADDGHLELAGMNVLLKPIAIVHPQTSLPGIAPRYRPHLATCTAVERRARQLQPA